LSCDVMDDAGLARHYAAFTADLDGKHGTMESAAWLEQYTQALPDIQRAFAHALRERSLSACAIAIAFHTGWFWHESGRAGEGIAMLRQALALPLSTRDAAELHRLLGMLHFGEGDYSRAIEHAQEALEHGLEIEPAEPPHRYYTLFANALLYAGRYEEAEQYYRMAVDSAHSWNREGDLSTCRFNLAILLYECKGDFAGARRMLQASFETRAADEFDDALAQETLARIAFLERNFDEAVTHVAAALDLLERVGNTEHILEVSMRGCVYLTLEDRTQDAASLWGRYAADALASRNPETQAAAIEAAAALSTARGHLGDAVRLRAYLERFRQQHHLVVFPVEQRLYDAWDFAVRSVLGKAAYEHAKSSAQSMHLSDAAGLLGAHL